MSMPARALRLSAMTLVAASTAALPAALMSCGAMPDPVAAGMSGDSVSTYVAQLQRQRAVVDAENARLRRLLNGVDSAMRSGADSGVRVVQVGNCGDDVDCSIDREMQLRVQVRDVLQRLRSTQQQLRVVTRSVSGAQDDSATAARTRQLQAATDSLAALAQRKVLELEQVRTRVDELTADSTASVALIAQLEARITAMTNADDSVYVIAAPKDQLLKLGAVQERGGTLITFGFGKALVPMAVPPSKAWRALSKADSVVIALPRADRWYEVISAHPLALVKADRERGNLRQGTLRILSPAAFWQVSRFLILQER